MEKVAISTEYIQLDQMLKLAGAVNSGGQVKFMVLEQSIYLNDTLVTERRKKIFIGDVVKVKDSGVWQVVRK